MEKEKETSLIVVKQLPIIEERLKSLSEEIDKKVANALALIVCDDTVKDVKKVRAELNTNFKELEAQRKLVKEKVLAPYQAFEDVYKTYVSDKFKKADSELKEKIEQVESEQKKAKEKEVKDYYSEYALSNNLEWLITYYDMANINITLSASIKSLKEQAKAFIDKVVDDLKLIDTQEHKIEILAEYKANLNVSNAITSVNDRFKREEEERTIQEELKKQKEIEKETIEKVNEVATPMSAPVEEEKRYSMTFKVYGTMEQLKSVKYYLEQLKKDGVTYE